MPFLLLLIDCIFCMFYIDFLDSFDFALNSISGKGKSAHNLFMVGDVKQSIYKFRMARPELFMGKYAENEF